MATSKNKVVHVGMRYSIIEGPYKGRLILVVKRIRRDGDSIEVLGLLVDAWGRETEDELRLPLAYLER